MSFSFPHCTTHFPSQASDGDRHMKIEEYLAFSLSFTFSASSLLSSSLALTKELSDYRFFVRFIIFLRNFWQKEMQIWNLSFCIALIVLSCHMEWQHSEFGMDKERKHTQIRMCLLVADAVNAVYISVTLRLFNRKDKIIYSELVKSG